MGTNNRVLLILIFHPAENCKYGRNCYLLVIATSPNPSATPNAQMRRSCSRVAAAPARPFRSMPDCGRALHRLPTHSAAVAAAPSPAVRPFPLSLRPSVAPPFADGATIFCHPCNVRAATATAVSAAAAAQFQHGATSLSANCRTYTRELSRG